MKVRVYQSVYADEEWAGVFHDAICELINQHPEWDADIDIEWETEYEEAEDHEPD